MTEPSQHHDRSGVSRRRLLQAATVAAAGLAGCGPGERSATPGGDVDAAGFGPLPPQAPPLCSLRSFFTTEEAAIMDAVAARLIPGDHDDPGAREACAVAYIDAKLAEFERFATPTYTDAPFAVDVPGHPGEQRGAGSEIEVNEDVLPRHGFQSKLTPQATYRDGLAALDRFARRRFGRSFTALDENRQDHVLSALERGDAGGFGDLKPDAFFKLVLQDVIEGTFSDPAYGGNRDLVGWRLVGYPGPQRAYTPRELVRGTNKRPQSLAQLSPTHAGHPDEHALHVLSGTRQARR
jgi:gluconate 2-dehydrogenase gamma chain